MKPSVDNQGIGWYGRYLHCTYNTFMRNGMQENWIRNRICLLTLMIKSDVFWNLPQVQFSPVRLQKVMYGIYKQQIMLEIILSLPSQVHHINQLKLKQVYAWSTFRKSKSLCTDFPCYHSKPLQLCMFIIPIPCQTNTKP